MKFRFPAEIEDEIFKIVLCTPPYLKTDAQLAVVYKRVQSCIELILYETIVLRGSKDLFLQLASDPVKVIAEHEFTHTLYSKPATFFKKTVKNLFVSSSVSNTFLLDLLSICSGVQHLQIYYTWVRRAHIAPVPIPLHVIASISAMPLRSLEHGMLNIYQLSNSPHGFPHLQCLSLSLLDFDAECSPTDAIKCFPQIQRIVIRVASLNCVKVYQHLQTTLNNFPNLRFLTVLLVDFYHWGYDGFDCQIRKWKDLDERVEVFSSTTPLLQIWMDRVTTGRNDSEYFKLDDGIHTEDMDYGVLEPSIDLDNHLLPEA